MRQLLLVAIPVALCVVGGGVPAVAQSNAYQVDGMEAAAFAQDADLQMVETKLVALLDQLDGLGLAPVPRTGQTTCYDAVGTVIDCTEGIGPGQDGDLQLGVPWPNPRFTKNGDGTVTDNLTGLIWLENADCADATMDWATALAFANTLFDGSVAHNGGDCGLSDVSTVGAWRLPNLREMQSLAHYGVSLPAVPNTAGTGRWVDGDPFSNVQRAFYWSSTSVDAFPAGAFAVNLNAGSVSYDFKHGNFRVWPVRGAVSAVAQSVQTEGNVETDVEARLVALQDQLDGLGLALVPRTGQTTCYDAVGTVIDCTEGIGPGQDGDLQLGEPWPNPRFTKNGDGTVTDNLTGLIWLENADCAAATTDWETALAFANTLFDGSVAHNGGDCGLSDVSVVGAWRLPNLREMQSLAHYGVSLPAVPNTAGTGRWVDGDPFSNVQSAFYWSSTSLAAAPDRAFAVDLSAGFVSYDYKRGRVFRVWPVRGAAHHVLPEIFTFQGELLSGTLEDLLASDDNRVVIRSTPLLGGADGLAVAITVEGRTTLESPTELRFTYEGQASAPGVAQRIYLFNFAINDYVLADEQPATSEDSTATVVVTSNVDDFVGGDGLLRARIGLVPSLSGFFMARIQRVDLTAWDVTP